MKMETFTFSKAVSKEKLIHGEIEKYIIIIPYQMQNFSLHLNHKLILTQTIILWKAIL